MDSDQFRTAAHDMVEYVTGYLDNIEHRQVLPTVEPGYIRSLIPDHAPEEPEPWSEVLKDIERVIMPGVTHWHSPHFHAFFPTANSYPAMLGDMLSDAIACIGFTWKATPACTELEMVTLDWLGKLLDLPDEFLFSGSGGKGGGVIQGTASEATLVSILAAKNRFVKKYKELKPEMSEMEIISKLVAYCSVNAHSSVERAGMIAGVKMQAVEPDENYSLKGEHLLPQIEEDLRNGLIPFHVTATLGTTDCCSFDDVVSIGKVCKEKEVYLHIDAAYAGAAFICPEFRPLLNGVEYADSFNFNPHKWMLVTFDCSAMWLKDSSEIVDAFNVDPIYLKHDQQGTMPDYRHWQIPLGRRFRSLKLWFVLRLYGASKIREHIRKQVNLAVRFADHLRADPRFEIPVNPNMGLVCFNLKDKSNEVNEKLLAAVNGRGKIFIVPAKLRGRYVIRFAICARTTEDRHIDEAWEEIKAAAEMILSKN